jgi:hypothetical protein
VGLVWFGKLKDEERTAVAFLPVYLASLFGFAAPVLYFNLPPAKTSWATSSASAAGQFARGGPEQDQRPVQCGEAFWPFARTREQAQWRQLSLVRLVGL